MAGQNCPRQPADSMSTKLFVGNLDFNVTENDLQDAFAAHGTVVEANVVTDRATGRSKGYGFVSTLPPSHFLGICVLMGIRGEVRFWG